jgi:hypothetical protein
VADTVPDKVVEAECVPEAVFVCELDVVPVDDHVCETVAVSV